MSSKNNKIMVIDDDANTNNLMKFFLQKEDYNVDSFTNSIEALHSFRKDEYDLVLLDSKMQKLKEEMSLYKKFKEIDNKVSICFTNTDRESIQEIKQQVLQSNNNNDTMSKSLSLNDQTKLDILLLNDKDMILIKPEYFSDMFYDFIKNKLYSVSRGSSRIWRRMLCIQRSTKRCFYTTCPFPIIWINNDNRNEYSE